MGSGGARFLQRVLGGDPAPRQPCESDLGRRLGEGAAGGVQGTWAGTTLRPPGLLVPAAAGAWVAALCLSPELRSAFKRKAYL